MSGIGCECYNCYYDKKCNPHSGKGWLCYYNSEWESKDPKLCKERRKELKRELEKEEQEKLEEKQNLEKQLSLEVFKKAVKLVGKYKEPFEEFANRQGYSLKDGDLMLLPKELEEFISFPIPEGVKFTELVSKIFLLKNQNPLLLFKHINKASE